MQDIIIKFCGFFFNALRGFLPGIVGKVISTLGIGMATYSYILPQVVDFIQTFLNSMPQEAINLLGALRVDIALTIVFSAYATKLGTKITPIKLETTNP